MKGILTKGSCTDELHHSDSVSNKGSWRQEPPSSTWELFSLRAPILTNSITHMLLLWDPVIKNSITHMVCSHAESFLCSRTPSSHESYLFMCVMGFMNTGTRGQHPQGGS